MRFFRLLGFSIQFMTRIPVNKQFNVTEKDFASMTMFFPVPALLVGLIMAAVYYVFSLFDGLIWVGCLAAVIAACLATGGLHIDGFADMCDAFGARKSPERTLEILKDSRMGTYGVLAILFVVLLKFLLIRSMQNVNIYMVLIATPLAGKIPLAVTAAACKYPREEGTGKLLINNITLTECIVCVAVAQALLFLCLGRDAFILLPILVAAGLVMTALSNSRIGGVTGDILGASNEIGELALLVFMAMIGAPV